MRIGWQFIHDALSQARSVDDPDNEGQQTSFYGMADRLAFVADLPAYVGTGGLSRITLQTRPSSEGDRLVLTRQLFDTSATGQDATTHSAVLVDEMDRLEIRYFGQPDRDSTPGWHPTWVDSDVLPSLVVVRVVPAHGNPWPTLTASPLTGVAALEDDDVLLDEDARFDDEEEK
jgi:general secretion pathway protein J